MTVKLCYDRYQDLCHFLKYFPRSCLAEVKYLALGIKPDPPPKDTLGPSNIIPYGDKPTVNILLHRTIPYLQLARPSPPLPQIGSAVRHREAGEGEDTRPCVSSAPLQDTIGDEV